MIDDYDDIFKLMDRMFGRDSQSSPSSKYIDYRNSERQVWDSNIYYTITLKDVNKEELDIKSYKDHIDIIINKDAKDNIETLDLPYEIIPDKTIITYVNNILDITTYISEDAKGKRIKIKD